MRPSDTQLIEEARERMRPIRDGECFGGVGRLAGARCVPRDDVKPIRQTGELTPPTPRVAEESVQQDEWRAAAGRAVGDGLAADIRVEEFLAGQDAASTFRFSPFSTPLKVFKIGPLIIGPTMGASNPRGSKPCVIRLPFPFGAMVARIAILVAGRAVLSSSNDRPSS